MGNFIKFLEIIYHFFFSTRTAEKTTPIAHSTANAVNATLLSNIRLSAEAASRLPFPSINPVTILRTAMPSDCPYVRIVVIIEFATPYSLLDTHFIITLLLGD